MSPVSVLEKTTLPAPIMATLIMALGLYRVSNRAEATRVAEGCQDRDHLLRTRHQPVGTVQPKVAVCVANVPSAKRSMMPYPFSNSCIGPVHHAALTAGLLT